MMSKVGLFLASVLISVARSEPPSTDYGTPLGAPLNSYGTPNYNANSNDHHDYGEPKSYEFGYQVKDDYSGNNYNRQEQSDGNQVRGEYRVQLPDGRTQIVTYYADWQTGFHADVRYEGTAQYPEQYNTYHGGNNNGGYNNGGYNNNHNNNNNGVSSQYGAPQNNYNNNNNYHQNNGYNNGGGSATSSVTIKDYSGNDNQGYNYNNNNNNNYDSYNNGGYGNKARPSNEYGAP